MTDLGKHTTHVTKTSYDARDVSLAGTTLVWAEQVFDKDGFLRVSYVRTARTG